MWKLRRDRRERIGDNLIDEEISIGDYVLSGGEIPAATTY